MVKLEIAIQALADNNVDFVIVGGVAVRIHSSTYSTLDLDFCYSRTKENLERIVSALSPFKPRPRDFPLDLPYFFDMRSLQNGTNFTFETTAGDIDLLGEVAGIGTYEEVEKSSEIFEIYERDVRVLSVDGLIRAKTAAGREKDFIALRDLKILKELSENEE